MRQDYRIGPAVVRIESDSSPWTPPLSDYDAFKIPNDEPPSLLIRVNDDPPPVMQPESESIFELTNHWQLSKEGTGYRLAIFESGAVLRAVARFNPTLDRVDFYRQEVPAWPTVRKEHWSVGEVMIPLVQWWLVNWLAQNSLGFMIHGGAVSFRGLGIAFSAPSGGGKSTLAQLCSSDPGMAVLNDERIVLWHERNGWWVSGTPWHGLFEQVSPAVTSLSSLLFLKKSPFNKEIPLSPSEAARKIVEESFMPVWNPGELRGLFSAIDRFVQEVPVSEFWFAKDGSAVRLLKETMGSAVGEPF